MKRKAIQLAQQTLVVSLPSKWVQKHSVSKGDEINIEEQGEKLVISKDLEKNSHKRLIINTLNAGKGYKKLLGAAFKAGYDEIEIDFTDSSELENIHNYMKYKLPNFSISTQTKNSIVLTKIYGDSFQDFDSALKRFLIVLENLSFETLEGFSNNDKEWLRQAILIKEEPDMLANYLRRNIVLGFDLKYARPAPLYAIIEMIIFTADLYREFCRKIIDNSLTSSRETIEIFDQIIEYHKSFSKLFYNFNLEDASIYAERKELIKKHIAKCTIKNSKDRIALEYFERIVDSLYDLHEPLLVLRL